VSPEQIRGPWKTRYTSPYTSSSHNITWQTDEPPSIISFLGTIFIVLSLAELASMYPTAGGQYHWVAVMAPPPRMRIASWFTAWISIGGQTMLTASAALAGGLQLQALVYVNDETYVPQRWQGMLFYDLVLVYSLLINVYGVRVLAGTNTASGELL